MKSSDRLSLFTLIHVQRDERSLHNSSVTSFDDQIRLYVSCAQQLAKSLRRAGLELTILTNDPSAIRRAGNQTDVAIQHMACDLPVPSGIPFFSAHFKIDAFRHLAALGEQYVGLLDADMICLGEVPDSLQSAIRQRLPLYYDITDQVTPAHGAPTVIRDKVRLQGRDSLGLWAGGEFIAGPPKFFRTLYDECARVSPAYFGDFNTFHQQNDEMLTSVAIEELITRSNMPMIDAGALSLVGRFWSVPTLHVQKPIAAYHKHFLLHLPADKQLLSSPDVGDLSTAQFFRHYRRHLRASRLSFPVTAVTRKLRRVGARLGIRA